MKKSTFLLGAALAALMTGSAGAADLAVKAPRVAPVIAPAFTWTGCYLGIHGGGGATRSNFTDSASIFLQGPSDSGSNSWGNGGLAGGQIGCNYQTGVLVLGIEGEGYWSGMKSSQELSINTGEGILGFRAEARNKYDYTVAGRIGVAYERAFIYGKAGWAWGRFDFSAADTFNGVAENSIFGSNTLNGPLFGVGVEYALTNNWTVKGEYNYINYGLSPTSFTACSGGGTCQANAFSLSQSAEKHIFKFGVNYLFNAWQTPVVAKY
jgi:outer membrane immunogenic protein